MIDAYASLPHYVDHLAPIWWALTPDERGTFYASRLAVDRARAEGVFPLAVGRPTPGEDPTLVAGFSDLRVIGRRPPIFVEHGAGQTYPGDERSVNDASYSGGRERDNVRLFLAPNQYVNARNRAGTPGAASVVVGSPKLDWWVRAQAAGDLRHDAPTIAMSFHWDCTLVPETRSSWAYYDGALQALCVVAKARGWRVLGHGHPRLYAKLARRWAQLGVECTPDFDQVLREADVYVCDNSSTIYEFARLAGPVVVLNAPWYRRHVEHGLRFWTHADVGVQVDAPAELVAGVEAALCESPGQRAIRLARSSDVYPLADGNAALRAADAIRTFVL